MQPLEFYTDYRKFLADFYKEKKRRSPSFSYRNFCTRAGLRSPSLFREVVAGTRNLTASTVVAFVKGLGLNERDGRFFENLVFFNQAKREETKRKYLAALRGLRYQKPQKVIPAHLFAFYERWYHPVIRELALLPHWKGDFSMLAKSVCPPIKVSEARESVALQMRLGFLKQGADGAYQQTDPAISTGAEVSSLAVRQLNRSLAQLGVEAIDRFPPHERDISSVVMGIPFAKLDELKREIGEFRKRLATLVSAEDIADSAYALVIEFFPTGKAGPGKGRRS
jgi:uncharacterized protein (TIGR02147 family)